jgi:hypothetical protein
MACVPGILGRCDTHMVTLRPYPVPPNEHLDANTRETSDGQVRNRISTLRKFRVPTVTVRNVNRRICACAMQENRWQVARDSWQ